MKRFIAHLARTLALVSIFAFPADASQDSYVMPTAGPMSMSSFVTTYLNPGLQALGSCHLGTTAPANGPGSAPLSGQCWFDTSGTPWSLKYYDGTTWVAFGSLNASTHAASVPASELISAQSGTSFTLLDANRGELVTQSNASSSAFTLPQAATSSQFLSGWWADVANLGIGTQTITPATSTINGAASLVLKQGRGARIVSDGTNYQAFGYAPLSDTGSGAMVLQTSPTLVTPALGAATATSINGNIWTAGTGTLTLGAGKTATINNTLTFTGTDASSVAFGAGGTAAYTENNLSAFATTTSAQLAGVLSDETGSGAAVFATSPSLTTPSLGIASATTLNKVAITAPATGATITIPDGVTLTGPAASGTTMTLGNAETVTGVKSFNSGKLQLNGSVSGAGTLNPPSAASTYVWTLPAATDTLVGRATTDTLLGKTFDTAGSGNSLLINGLAATANTGTGAVVRATSPTISGHPTVEGVTSTGATGTGKLVFDTSPVLATPSIDAVTISQKIRLNNAVTSTQITADQNDYTGTDGSNTCATKKTIRISSDAARNVTGLSCSQADGDLVSIYNAGSFAITLKDESVSSTAVNRFGFGADLILGSKQGALLQYDGTASRYRQIGGPSASGGGAGTVTSITAGAGLSGGTITTSGTISIGSGGVVGHAIATTAAVATDSSANMPGASTSVPQNTQGSQLITVSITPKSSSDICVVEASVNGAASVSSVMQIGIFQDSAAGALGSNYLNPNGLTGTTFRIGTKFYQTCGTTSATTFKVRFGLDRAGTMTVNGAAGAQQIGGTLYSYIEVTEYAP